MPLTSQKLRDFVSGPMGDKPVTALPGIGPVLGGRLAEQGYDKAYAVYGQYLTLKKNEESFINWQKGITGANNKQAGDCYNGLKDWSNAFM